VNLPSILANNGKSSSLSTSFSQTFRSIPRYDLGSVAPRTLWPDTCINSAPELSIRSLSSVGPPTGNNQWLDLHDPSSVAFQIEGRMASDAITKRELGPLLSTTNCLFCPGATSNEPAVCISCLHDKSGTCPYDPYSGPGCPSGSLSKREFLHELERRGNTQKKIHILGYSVDSGSYPSCGVKFPQVSRWYDFSDDANCNDFAFSKVSQNKINAVSDFVTEHVYEAQMIGDFLKFLTTLTQPPGAGARANWKKVDTKFLLDSLLCVQGTTTCLTYTYPNAASQVPVSLLTHMVDQAGNGLSKSGLSDLALARRDMNGQKGIMMRLQTVNPAKYGTDLSNYQRVVKEVSSSMDMFNVRPG
jgi:hypothetical protein